VTRLEVRCDGPSVLSPTDPPTTRPHRSPSGRSLATLLVIATVSLWFVSEMFGVRQHAWASFADSSALRITSPVDESVLDDGNLVLIEGTSRPLSDGEVDRVELSIDESTAWAPVERGSEEPEHWRFVWSDPAPGGHRIQVRSLGRDGMPRAAQTISLRVDDAWSSSFVIDNPYAIPGSYRKGQLHIHTTGSFDGWNSLPPADDALEYKRRGYQFVVITDHDTVSYPQELNDQSFLAIPGFESTSEFGHITASFTTQAISPELPSQKRLDAITGSGGLAILAHPGWQVGWSNTDFRDLHGFFAFELFNGLTTITLDRQAKNAALWHNALNRKGWANRMWAVAVDDSHDPTAIDKGWVMVKTPQLTEEAIKQSLKQGAFYASNGPSFGVLGVRDGAITASSPNANVIRFINQDGKLLAQEPAAWAEFSPSGTERWVRVEAVLDDGRAAWSQPFWLLPNKPKVAYLPTWGGTMALVGRTIPGARMQVSERGDYLGNVLADDRGEFAFRSARLTNAPHEFRLVVSSPWPDRVESPPMVLAYSPAS